MNIKEFISGIVAIADNKIDEPDSDMIPIKQGLEKSNIPVIAFSDIPSKDMVPSLGKCSIVILDWDFSDASVFAEGVVVGDEFKREKEKELIEFITKLYHETFVPIFIFTAKNIDAIIESLEEARLFANNKPNRIFVKSKTEVSDEKMLFDTIEEWMKRTPAAYLFKYLENTVDQTKTKMFLDLYDCSSSWPSIIWDTLKEDSPNNVHYEFGSFLAKNLFYRIGEYEFDEGILTETEHNDPTELMKVIEGERFIRYEKEKEPAIPFTGDVFFDKEKGEYYLNIRAQCDLARHRNPDLYLIKGKANNDITLKDVMIMIENEKVFLVINKTKEERIELHKDLCENDLIQINKNLKANSSFPAFSQGILLGKKVEYPLAGINGEKSITFSLNIECKQFNEVKHLRIGRLLPPYITSIQQSCAHHIIREGILPVPERMFYEK